jgi:hypothetical protein
MTTSEGAKAFRLRNGEVRSDELPSTRTAVQRGELARRAQAGDKTAHEALRLYREAEAEKLLEDRPKRAGYDDTAGGQE